MLHTFHAPEPITLRQLNIFLAGTIDMGNSHDWQQDFINGIEPFCKSKEVAVFNPRRKKWESSWKQNIDNEHFSEQVNWELDALEQADYIVMFLKKNSKSPISLLELGLFADSGKLLVCCEEGYWRKGNVDIVCQRKGIKQFANINDVLTFLVTRFGRHKN